MDELTRDEELETLVVQLEEAGLVEQYTNADGKEAMRLTPAGEKVARQLAMFGEAGQDELMDALLEARDKG